MREREGGGKERGSSHSIPLFGSHLAREQRRGEKRLFGHIKGIRISIQQDSKRLEKRQKSKIFGVALLSDEESNKPIKNPIKTY